MLVWTTRVGGAGVLHRPEEAYPTNGALATVPRMDGRGGGAAAQVLPLPAAGLAGPPRGHTAGHEPSAAARACTCARFPLPQPAHTHIAQTPHRPNTVPTHTHPPLPPQMAVSIDGTLSIKSLQGPPLPAIIHQKFRLRCVWCGAWYGACMVCVRVCVCLLCAVGAERGSRLAGRCRACLGEQVGLCWLGAHAVPCSTRRRAALAPRPAPRSASGGRLRISLKAQLLDDEGEGLGTRRTSLCTISRSAGAKYATTWRRLHA